MLNLIPNDGLTFDDVTLVPKMSEITSRHDVDLNCGRHFGYKLTTPILSANMATVTGPTMCGAMRWAGGIGVLHRFQSIKDLEYSLSDLSTARVSLIGSVGVDRKDCMARLKVYDKHNCNVICIDVAHGHHIKVIDTIKFIKNKYPHMKVIAGNICTAEAAVDLHTAGADILKVGVGPGSHCTTRVVTGHGVPQLTAISNVYNAWSKQNSWEHYKCPVGIIADGGIRNSGDIAKALAVGADYVMIGRLLAGCKESPSEAVNINGQLQKVYRGSASYEAQQGRRDKSSIISEGVQSVVPYTGETADVISRLTVGIKSACSYSGASNLAEFKVLARLMRITHSSHIEGTPHGARL